MRRWADVADGNYSPHPLVTGLAKGLKADASGKLSPEAGTPLDQALQALQSAAKAKKEQAQEAVDVALADEIANDPALPELHTFAGFLGGVLDDSGGKTGSRWQLLYFDAKLRTWLLVDEKNILLRSTVDDETSPYGTRDHVWLKSDASVSEGEGAVQTDEIQARFMRGAFVSAGQFAASVSSGTFASVTGPACPLTPGCCGIRTK
jgi:hypothetical protein